jgi:hypothetical protein
MGIPNNHKDNNMRYSIRSIAYGSEAMIPVEIGMPSYKQTSFNKEENNAALRENLDLLDKRQT